MRRCTDGLLWFVHSLLHKDSRNQTYTSKFNTYQSNILLTADQSDDYHNLRQGANGALQMHQKLRFFLFQ